jgi:hypothetical protein
MKAEEQRLRDEKQRFVEENAEVWTSVPWLAALAGDKYEPAYKDLRWLLATDGTGVSDAAIDLWEPRIVPTNKSLGRVADHILDRLRSEQIDADAVVRSLLKEARKPLSSRIDADAVYAERYESLMRLYEQAFPLSELAEDEIYARYPEFPESGTATKTISVDARKVSF